MNVGILGSGDVAKALARGFLGRGDRVMLGTRDSGKLSGWIAEAGDRASAGSFADAAEFGELAIVATLGTATAHALEMAGAGNFEGKTVWDVTNPLKHEGGPPELFVGFTDSLGEQVQRALPGAKVVKVYNTVGNALMIHPKVQGGPPDMFLCGNDEGAKNQTSALVREFGWNPVDMGGIEAARVLEPMCIVWVDYGVRTGTWTHAFKFVRA